MEEESTPKITPEKSKPKKSMRSLNDVLGKPAAVSKDSGSLSVHLTFSIQRFIPWTLLLTVLSVRLESGSAVPREEGAEAFCGGVHL